MNIRTLTIVAAFMLTALTGPSSAAFFDEFKMVGSYGSTTLQSTFSDSQVPYLYYKVSPGVNAQVLTSWLNSDGTTYVLNVPTTPSTSVGWLSLSNWNDAGGSKDLGNWTVTGVLKQGTRQADRATANFTAVVTPEPMSLLLYGLGGLPIAAHLIRRRKTAA